MMFSLEIVAVAIQGISLMGVTFQMVGYQRCYNVRYCQPISEVTEEQGLRRVRE
jgi:hypothetical protein